MNITDVGHLVSDGDEGEDKLEKSAKKHGKTAREVADFFTKDFFINFNKLRLVEPEDYARATEFIPEQIELVELLLEKGFAYQTKQAIYFDTTKLDDYGKLTGQKLTEKETGARDDVVTDKAKHHPQDFALWFFTVERFAEHEMQWESPWGNGFPGWHLECSAIVHATLGEPIDIHTGGVDHIGTHHTNEIAQTEAGYGEKLANFWIHNNHMMIDGKKISKSLGNGYTLKDLEIKGFSAMDFKLLVLQSHYRSQSNFTWESLEAAQANLNSIYAWADEAFQPSVKVLSAEKIKSFKETILKTLDNDLNTAEALAAVNVIINQGAPTKALLDELENLLGLDLAGRKDITAAQKDLIKQREAPRASQDWPKSDELRAKLGEEGIEINDTADGPIWSRKAK